MVKVGINLMRAQELTGGDFAGVYELAQLADRMGVDEVHISDHVAMSKTGYATKGPNWPYDIDFPGWYEPMVTLSAVAAMTKNVRLSTNVMVAPLRPAILLAKQIATLDVISNGRVDLNFGVGWQKEEFDASGLPFDDRFRHVEEQISACRTLWGNAPASFEGERVKFKDLYSLPQPVQGANVPICLGVAALRGNIARMARVADGWYPSPLDDHEIAAGVTALKQAFKDNGRDPDKVIVRSALMITRPGGLTIDQQFASADKLIAAGVNVIVGNPMVTCRTTADWKPYIERLLRLKK